MRASQDLSKLVQVSIDLGQIRHALAHSNFVLFFVIIEFELEIYQFLGTLLLHQISLGSTCSDWDPWHTFRSSERVDEMTRLRHFIWSSFNKGQTIVDPLIECLLFDCDLVLAFLQQLDHIHCLFDISKVAIFDPVLMSLLLGLWFSLAVSPSNYNRLSAAQARGHSELAMGSQCHRLIDLVLLNCFRHPVD